MTTVELIVGFLRTGVTLTPSKSEGTQLLVSDEWMRDGRNGRRFSETVWRREDGIGSGRQVGGQPDLTSHRMSSGKRGEKDVRG